MVLSWMDLNKIISSVIKAMAQARSCKNIAYIRLYMLPELTHVSALDCLYFVCLDVGATSTISLKLKQYINGKSAIQCVTALMSSLVQMSSSTHQRDCIDKLI